MTKEQVSNWEIPSQSSNTQINIWESSRSNYRRCSPIFTNNAWTNNVDYTQEKKSKTDQR
jgi:hypothetical protein